jgi:hypothetical protein
MLAVAVPQAPVTVSVYVPLVETVMELVVAPVDHELPVAEEEVSVTEPPAQKVVGPLGVILAVVTGLTVTVCEAVADPQLFVTVNV